MNVTKLDQLLQYALVVAAQARHGVTLTQLVKYAYLGDLEFARCHEGQTYTETEMEVLTLWTLGSERPRSRARFNGRDRCSRGRV